MHCAKWLSGSGEEDFLNFVNLFSLFLNYLPLEKGRALHLNKFESPSPKVLEKKLKIGKVYRRTDGRTDRQTDAG